MAKVVKNDIARLERENNRLRCENNRLIAELEYVAMMTDVELPEDEMEENEDVCED